MRPKVKFYLKFFFFIFFTFCFAKIFAELIIDGKIIWLKGLSSGTFHAVILTLIFRIIFQKELKKHGIDVEKKLDYFIKESATLESPITKTETLEMLKRTPMKRRCKILANISEDKIIIKTKMNFWTWGDVILIQITPISEGLNSIFIESKPKIKLTIYDWNMNKKNVEYIKQLIENYNGLKN